MVLLKALELLPRKPFKTLQEASTKVMASPRERKTSIESLVRFKRERSRRKRMPKKELADSSKQRVIQEFQFHQENKRTKITLAKIPRIDSLSGRKIRSKTYLLLMIKRKRVSACHKF